MINKTPQSPYKYQHEGNKAWTPNLITPEHPKKIAFNNIYDPIISKVTLIPNLVISSLPKKLSKNNTKSSTKIHAQMNPSLTPWISTTNTKAKNPTK